MLQRILTGYDVVYSGILEVDRYKMLDGKGREKKVMQGRVVGCGGKEIFWLSKPGSCLWKNRGIERNREEWSGRTQKG